MTQTSLSVVLPVYNAEQTLTGKVNRLLETLPDLTPKFEILVVDGGSSDQTREIADELARTFPQVRATTCPGRLEEQDLIEIGMIETVGEVLFIQDRNATVDSSKLVRLWELRNEGDLVLSRSELAKQSLRGLAAWGIRLEESGHDGVRSGVQMVRRQSLVWTRELISDAANQNRSVRTDPPGQRPDAERPRKATQHGRPRRMSRS